MQKKRNSSANALELRFFCIKAIDLNALAMELDILQLNYWSDLHNWISHIGTVTFLFDLRHKISFTGQVVSPYWNRTQDDGPASFHGKYGT